MISAWVLAGALTLAVGSARAQNSAARNYLALCRHHGVVSGKDTGPSPEGYELRGTIAGVAESGDGYNLLLRLDSGSTVTLVGSGAAPFSNAGVRVRALLQSSGSAVATSDPSLISVALEGDVAVEQAEEASRAGSARAVRSGATVRSSRSSRRRSVPMTSRSFSGIRPIAPVAPDETLAAYEKAIRYFNPHGSQGEVETIARAVLNYSIKYQVDARLVMAIFAVESSFKSNATSSTGAMGIGQLMPGTAASLGVRNAYDPMQNIEGAVKYIREQLDTYQGKDEWTRLQLVLASYNAGPNAVKKFGGVPPYRETQAYVRHVSSWFLHFLGADR